MAESMLHTKGKVIQQTKAPWKGLRGVIETCKVCKRVSRGVCNRLLNRIDAVVGGRRKVKGQGTLGLDKRYHDQIHGKMAPGTEGWLTHHGEYLKQQQELDGLIDLYDRQRCSKKGTREERRRNERRMSRAREWAAKPAPNSKMYRGPGARVGGARGGGGGCGGIIGPRINRRHDPRSLVYLNLLN